MRADASLVRMAEWHNICTAARHVFYIFASNELMYSKVHFIEDPEPRRSELAFGLAKHVRLTGEGTPPQRTSGDLNTASGTSGFRVTA